MSNFYWLPTIREQLLQIWDDHCDGDVWGSARELIAQTDNSWLWQADVNSRLVYQHGKWAIFLVYTDANDPMRIFVRHISYAQTYAHATQLAERLLGRHATAATPAASCSDWDYLCWN